MAITDLGMVRPGSTIIIPFAAFDSNDPSASVIISDFVLADIGIYKGTSMTERASTTGVVLLDTDGINIDGATGIHGFSIDLSSNATADFYTCGSRFYVTCGPITIDAATINFVPATFQIGQEAAVHNTTIATLASQTSFTLTVGSADNSAYVGCPVYVQAIASAIQVAIGYISAYTGSTKTVTLKADPGIYTIAAGDHISLFMPSNVQAVAGTTQTAGDLVAAVITNAAGADIAADIIAVKAETALIVADTNELQVDWVNGGRLDLLLDAIPTTAMRGTDSAALASVCTETRLAELAAANLPSDIDAILTDTGTGGVLLTSAYDFAKGTAAMTEAYAANAGAPTPVQALFAIHQMLMQFGISGTSLTVRKLDNTATAFVVTLDDALNPTDAKRV